MCQISGSISQKRRGHRTLKKFGVLCLNQCKVTLGAIPLHQPVQAALEWTIRGIAARHATSRRRATNQLNSSVSCYPSTVYRIIPLTRYLVFPQRCSKCTRYDLWWISTKGSTKSSILFSTTHLFLSDEKHETDIYFWYYRLQSIFIITWNAVYSVWPRCALIITEPWSKVHCTTLAGNLMTVWVSLSIPKRIVHFRTECGVAHVPFRTKPAIIFLRNVSRRAVVFSKCFSLPNTSRVRSP